VTADGSVKLLDFGIAKQLDNGDDPADQTQTGLRPMTLAYASPEQVRGEPLGTPTDVYSLGVTLYELLTGTLPFDLSNVSQTEAERIILEQEPAPPSVVARQAFQNPTEGKRLPQAGRTAWAEVDVLVMTAMHKDLRRRYGSVEALARDIEHYFKGEPLEARFDSARYRLGKFVRRNRRALSAAAVMVMLVAFFIARLAMVSAAATAEARRTQRIERFMLNLFDGATKLPAPRIACVS
jgi:serine/threonine protein kinase